MRAAEYLRDDQCIIMAKNSATFIKRSLFNQNTKRLLRSYRQGPSAIDGFCDDYSFLIRGLIDLYEYTLDENWIEWADQLQQTQIELFIDNNIGGFFSVAEDRCETSIRMKDGCLL